MEQFIDGSSYALKVENINFNDKCYPVYHLKHGKFFYCVAPKELEDSLFDNDYNFISPDAEIIDAQIAYYFDKDEEPNIENIRQMIIDSYGKEVFND